MEQVTENVSLYLYILSLKVSDKVRQKIFLKTIYTGCPKKKCDLWKMVTEGHWVELE